MDEKRLKELYRRFDNAHRLMWHAGRRRQAKCLTNRFIDWLARQM